MSTGVVTRVGRGALVTAVSPVRRCDQVEDRCQGTQRRRHMAGDGRHLWAEFHTYASKHPSCRFSGAGEVYRA